MTVPTVPTGRDDERFLRAALAQARRAGDRGDLAVGAVAVVDGDVVAAGGNEVITSGDPSAHAEVVVLRALEATGLPPGDAVLYTTFEPCPMCLGACLVHGVGAVVVGGTRRAGDRAWGGYTPAGLAAQVADGGPRVEVREGPLADECRELRAASLPWADPARERKHA
ncbi:deaminase [Isoptericola sp. NPDC056578]|uniref:deaminase n=1 Tax=Isoptericola sp. NPDC056578 TaxID=3345870 RepID=UPI0036754083